MDAYIRCSSAEQSRLNKSKSRGATTLRGKAIAAQNGRKHGLLAQKPPLLASEDLTTFQGIYEFLIHQYCPETAIEWHLIEQITMCIIRQRRIWHAEVSSEYPSNLNRKREDAYPYYVSEDERGKTVFHPENRALEKNILHLLRGNLKPFIEDCKSKEAVEEHFLGWAKRTKKLLKSTVNGYPGKIGEFTPDHLDTISESANRRLRWEQEKERIEAREEQDQSLWWKTRCLLIFVGDQLEKRSYHQPLVQLFNEQIEVIFQKCGDRLNELAQIETQIKQLEQQEAESKLSYLDKLGIPEDRLMRYESHINRQLEKAIQQLEQIRQQRASADFSGSLGN